VTLTTLLKSESAGTGNQSQVGSDIAGSSDNAVVSVAGAGSGGLPQVFLDVAFDAAAGPVYAEAVALALPTVHYRLSEPSGPVIDQMGRLNLAVVGGVTRAAASLLPGDPNTSYDFNGSTGLLVGNDNGLLDPPPDVTDPVTQLTLEAVVNADSLTGTRVIMSRRVTGTEALIFDFRLQGGSPQIVVADPTDVVYVYTSTHVLTTGTSVHLACVIAETFVALYINGELSAIFPKSWTQLKQSAVSSIYVGSSTLAGVNFFDGRIDEPAIYEVALPKEEVQYHSFARATSIAFTWTTVSDDIIATSRQLELSVKRGRTDIFREPETGLMQTRLRNQDRRFDPGNASSAYFPNVDPARPCRLRAIKDSVSY
jgi:hypothetical protein